MSGAGCRTDKWRRLDRGGPDKMDGKLVDIVELLGEVTQSAPQTAGGMEESIKIWS